jgi:hypothetical protein
MVGIKSPARTASRKLAERFIQRGSSGVIKMSKPITRGTRARRKSATLMPNDRRQPPLSPLPFALSFPALTTSPLNCC